MSSAKTRVGSIATLVLCAFALPGTPAPGSPIPDGEVTLTVAPGPGPLTPGTVGEFTACGNPGDYVLLLFDVVVAPSQLPFLGGIDIGLGQSPLFLKLFRVLDANGKVTVRCGVRCDNTALFNDKFYVQVVSFNRSTRQVCVSNMEHLTWEDDGTCSGQGCTPGYWKQSQHFDDWTAPYAPGNLFSSVFEDAFPGKTLLEVLNIQGGQLEALGRHVVAGLLNAAHPGVSYALSTPQDVINAFNAVYPGTDADYETLKDTLAGFNEAGCPL